MLRRSSFYITSIFMLVLLASCATNLRNTQNATPNNPAQNAVYLITHKLDIDGDNRDFVQFPPSRPSSSHPVFIFDPNNHAWAFYDEDGKLANTGRASGGQLYCEDVARSCKTITGIFTIISKGGADCTSGKYPLDTNGGAPMPYCMRFHRLGYAIHGSYDVPNYNASHGCIRVTPEAAEWLNRMAPIGTTVIVMPYKN